MFVTNNWKLKDEVYKVLGFLAKDSNKNTKDTKSEKEQIKSILKLIQKGSNKKKLYLAAEFG